MMTQNRKIIYAITSFSIIFFHGLLCAYSITKSYLNEEYLFSESFLGFVDLLSFLGRFIGSLALLIVPSDRPKRMYFVYSLIQTFSFIIVVSVTISKFILSLALFLIGFTRSSIMVPYLLLTQYFDSKKDAHYLNIWVSMIGIGGVISILLIGFLIGSAGFGWRSALMVWVGLFMIFALIQHVCIKQVKIEKKNNSKIEEAKEVLNFFREFFQKRTHKLILFDFMFQQQLSFKIALWFPYYFAKLGKTTLGYYVTIMYPLMQIFGSIAHEKFIHLNIISIPSLTTLQLLMNFGIYIFACFLDEKSSIYLLLIGISGFLVGGPYCRTAGSEATELVDGDARKKYLFVNFMKMARQILSGISMLLIGFCIEIYLKSFIYIIMLNALIMCFLHIYRRISERKKSRSVKDVNELDLKEQELI